MRWRPSTSASTTTSGCAHASSRQSASRRSAERDHVNSRARSSPSRRSSSCRRRPRRSRPRSPPRRAASTSTAAPPATSSVAPPRARHDRRPARHRLEHRQPEALVERREDEAARAAVERGELLVVDPARPSPAPRPRPSPGAPTTRSSTSGKPRRLDRAREVLARLERSDREHVVAAAAAGPSGVKTGSTPVRDDADALDRNVEELDELVTRERRDGDDRVGALARRGGSATRPGVPVPGREGVGVPEQRRSRAR